MDENNNKSKSGELWNRLTAEDYGLALVKKSVDGGLPRDFFVMPEKIKNTAAGFQCEVKKVLIPENPRLEEERSKAFYDDIFNKNFGDTGKLEKSGKPYAELLIKLIDFKKQHVSWGSVRGGQYLVPKDGHSQGFMAITSSGDDGGMFGVAYQVDVNFLLIRPFKIFEIWAAIGFISALFLLRERVIRSLDGNPANPTRLEYLTQQVHALRMQVAAADYCGEAHIWRFWTGWLNPFGRSILWKVF
jgi:hypothetical protein